MPENQNIGSPVDSVGVKTKKLRQVNPNFKKIIITALILLFAFGILAIIFSISNNNPPPSAATKIQDSKLKLNKVTILANENAFITLQKLPSSVKLTTKEITYLDGILTNTNKNYANLNAIYAKNKTAITIFDQASRKKYYQNPSYSDPTKLGAELFTSSLDMGAKYIRQIVKLKSAHSRYMIRKGKYNEAINDVLPILSLGQKIEDSQKPLIELLIAFAIKKTAYDSLTKIPTSKINPALKRSTYTEVLKYRDNTTGAQSALKVEYYMFSDLLKSSFGEAMKQKVSPKAFNLTKTQALYANRMTEAIQRMAALCSKIVIPKSKPIKQPSQSDLAKIDNAFGEYLVSTSITAFSSLQTKKCELDKLSNKVISQYK